MKTETSIARTTCPNTVAGRFRTVCAARLLPLLFMLLLVSAVKADQYGDFTYTTNNGTITITGYTGSGGAVTIPSTINVNGNDLPVTSIGDYAFNGCRSLTNLTINNSVTSIGNWAFYGCTSLTNATLGSGVTSIGSDAFYGCSKLTSITIPGSFANALAEPIQIGTIEDLQKIGNDPSYPLNGSYVLTQDIEASATVTWNNGAGFSPIASDSWLPFTGTFDGQGHVISGLVISSPIGGCAVGLFGYVASGGQVKNVGVQGGAVSMFCSGYIGGLVGSNHGTVTHCSMTGAVSVESGPSAEAGGLVGLNDHGTVTACYATGPVSGTATVGGLIGYNYCGTVTACFSTGTVSGANPGKNGGLIGYNHGTVTQCYAMGEVLVLGTYVTGGLIGYNDGTVNSSFWDLETSGRTGSDGGTGITTAQLLQSATFIAAGWDYVGTWAQIDGLTVPYFRAATAPGTTYSLTVTTNGNGNVLPSGGAYPAWSLVMLTPTPSAGFAFLRWVGDCFQTTVPVRTIPLPVVLHGTITVQAVFLANILIGSIEDLQKIGNDPGYTLDRSYIITQDIDASATVAWHNGVGFSPIGNDTSPFTGTLDGQGHVISGLTIHQTSENCVGLFHSVGSGAQVKNLGLEGGTVSGTASFWNGTAVGELIAVNGGTVTQCYATGAVSLSGTGMYAVGGLVGSNLGTVTLCYTAGPVSAADSIVANQVGGLVGVNSGTLTQCHATGTVSGSFYVGGLLGYNNYPSTVTQCYATGAVSGGIVGGLIAENGGTVTQCYATGALSGGIVGGLIGNNGCHVTGGAPCPVTQCYATGAVTASGTDSRAGGLVGTNYSGGTLTECYAAGEVSASGQNSVAGGLVAMEGGGTAQSSYWDMAITGQTASRGGTGESTAAMMTQATFIGWDFQSVWSIVEGKTYPYFCYQNTVDADFYATPTLTLVKCEVKFFDSSSGYPDNWDWDFGDLQKSIEQNPVHAYDAPGTYTVALAISGPYGTDTETKKDYIVIMPMPSKSELINALLGKGNIDNGDVNGDGKVDVADLVTLIINQP